MNPVRSTNQDNSALPAEVIAALQRGKKIEAIKLLREVRQIGLKEAKEQVEAYQGGRPATSPYQGDLPAEVIAALQCGNKIKAINLLRQAGQIGLKEAKQQVEAYQGGHPPTTGRASKKNLFILLALIVSFGWAFITSIDVISSLIVLANLDGYQADTFTIGKLRHDSDGEGGLTWGFEGRIAGRDERLYAPHLADAKNLDFGRLRKLFPAGTEMPAWYNPGVTDTLFQGRTLRVIPYSPDLKESELKRFMWWLSYCLLPFLLVLVLARRLDRTTKR